MKKANKILMKAIAILLCLVLITASVVSSTLARFAFKKDATNVIKFNKFGVELGLTLSDELIEFLGGEDVISSYTTVDGDSISIAIPSMKMGPGDDFTDAIKFSVSGDAGVRCKVIVDVGLVYNKSDFTINGTFRGLPVGMRFACLNTNGVKESSEFFSSWYSYDAMYPGEYGAKDICKKIDVNYLDSFRCYVEKVFEKGDDIVFYPNSTSTVEINDLYFDLFWPMSASDTKNEYDTYIAKKYDTIDQKIVFTVTIEQVSDTDDVES